MMNVNRTVFFGLSMTFLIGLASCGTTNKVPQEEVVLEEGVSYVRMRKVDNGYLTGNGNEGLSEGGVVVNSQAGWNKLMKSMNSVNQTIDDIEIDFSNRTVLAYFDEIRGSGGHTVVITEIKSDGTSLTAKVEKVPPREDAIEIMTQPYFIVSIEKTDLPVKFMD